MSATTQAISKRLDEGAVVNSIQNMAPPGTKAWMLCLGYLECDEGFVCRGGNTSLMSTKDKSFVNKRRVLPMYAILIEHPHEGLILWETGSGKDYPEQWGPVIADVFARTLYEPEHELEAAIAATGHSYKDVKAIILGHMHLDHAGGLDLFKDMKDVPIWVHERELKAAFYSVATGADAQVYLDHYMDTSLNWKTFDDREIDFAQVLDTGTFIVTGDLFHVKENYHDGIPQGWLARDHPSWFQSYQRMHRLETRTKGLVVMGHDQDTCNKVWAIQKENGGFLS